MAKSDGSGNRPGGPYDYEIGYKKPPVSTRFQKGRSGNPAGRPKGKVMPIDADHIFDQVLSALVPINENGRARKISKLRALYTQTVHKGLKGDNRAASLVFSYLARRAGRNEQGPVVEESADAQATKEFEAAFNEMAANLRNSFDRGEQDNDHRLKGGPEREGVEGVCRSSEDQ